MVFMGTKFHEKLIFSAFFSRELATNLCSWATRSITITLWNPETVAPPVWFQALVGWLRLTSDHCLNSLKRKPPIVFWLVWSKISCMNTFIFFSRAIVPLTDQNTPLWSLLKVSGSAVGFKQPTLEGLKAHWRRHIPRMPLGNCDLVAQERKFVANSRLKKAE